MQKLKDILYLVDKDNLYLKFKVKKQDYFEKGTKKKYTNYKCEIIPYWCIYNNVKLKNGALITIDNIKNLRAEEVCIYNDKIMINVKEYIKR